MALPKRKQIRLNEFNYSDNGTYFITVCTKDKQYILWNTNPVGADNIRPNSSKLSEYGTIVYNAILSIQKQNRY